MQHGGEEEKRILCMALGVAIFSLSLSLPFARSLSLSQWGQCIGAKFCVLTVASVAKFREARIINLWWKSKRLPEIRPFPSDH